MPNCLLGKLAIDLTRSKHYETNFKDLLTTLQGQKRKPPIKLTRSSAQGIITEKKKNDDEPIHILGIITDQVTVPKMDGTYGSALYKISFRLSKTPSALWRELFIRLWDSPPCWTTRHRPGIASVYGDQIILDGTTIEEVRDVHRETLIMCVSEANKAEQKYLKAERQKQELEAMKKKQHFENIANVAGDIKF